MENSQWYKEIWDLSIKNQSWVENTPQEVEFIIKELELNGNERILDLACGFGRHSLYLAKKGFSVVGIDITKDYIADAMHEAKINNIKAEFICDDIRNIKYSNEFDVVLNLADGAIGYLETEEENMKIFDVISKALNNNGKHFMDINNAEHAEKYFPKRHWEFGSKSLSLPEFLWNKETKRMIYRGYEFEYGNILEKPQVLAGENPTRLYTKDEIRKIFKERNMNIIKSYSKYDGKKDTEDELQLMVYSKKNI